MKNRTSIKQKLFLLWLIIHISCHENVTFFHESYVLVSAFSPASSISLGRAYCNTRSEEVGRTLPNVSHFFGKTYAKHHNRLHVNREPATTDAQQGESLPSVSASVQVNTIIPVSRISVCAGELCQCQGDEYEYTGGASDAVMKNLRSLNLPFPIDEVGCMGACGMGTMIVIDYENGDAAMTDGLDATLRALGIESEENSHLKVLNSPDVGVQNLSDDGDDETSSLANVVTASTSVNREHSRSKKRPILADARDRMRQEAASEVDQGNPWMNMFSYIVKKANNKLFGS